MLDRQRDVKDRVIETKDLRQHPLREAARQLPPIHLLIARQLAALVEADCHARLGFNEQVVLGEEPGEQHPVPVLVSALLHEMVNRSDATPLITTITELPDMESAAISGDKVNG